MVTCALFSKLSEIYKCLILHKAHIAILYMDLCFSDGQGEALLKGFSYYPPWVGFFCVDMDLTSKFICEYF